MGNVFLIEQRTKLSAQIEENEVSLQRFRLLNDYYQSDEKRLTTLKSVCSAISDMTSIVCPFCGTQNVSNEKLYDNFSKEQIISCLDADITSNKKLSTDLSSLLEELEEVYSSLITQQNSISQEIQEIVSEIDKAREHKLTPIQENLKRAIDKKSKIDNAIAFEQQVWDFEKKIQEQRDIADSEDADESAKLTVKDSCDLINEVKNLFKKWKFDSEKIAFSEDKQDILINNVLRANHGKGVKALGTTAFIIALMQTCLKHGKKHPSFVVIDSPLVTYKSPDVNIDAELPSDIVFDLYNSLSKDILGQTIILENTEVPNGIHANKIYFSGNSNCNSRQGFFYVE